MSGDDEIDIIAEGWRLLGRDDQAELIARGWVVTDLDVGDDAPLEFFWPPTAPVGYVDGYLPHRGRAYRTPWIKPTRITRTDSSWHVEYGEAIAQAPDAAIEYSDDKALLEDLARIEWWPMSVEEARTLQQERILHLTFADAYDDHSRAYAIQTEPYVSRLGEVFERIRSKTPRMMDDPDGWRWAGDLHARARIIDGEMWASAVRTARAGGDGWSVDGPDDGASGR